LPTLLSTPLAEAAGNDPAVPGLISYGGVGILAFFLLWAVRELWAREKQTADYHRERADRAESEVRRLNELLQSSTLPAVAKATEVMGQLLVKPHRREPS
jgi:hypothetical protein